MACCYILIIAVLHDVRPHFLRVPAPGAEEMSHFCSVMDAGTCRYIPVIEIWTNLENAPHHNNKPEHGSRCYLQLQLVVSLRDDASNTPPILLPTNGNF